MHRIGGIVNYVVASVVENHVEASHGVERVSHREVALQISRQLLTDSLLGHRNVIIGSGKSMTGDCHLVALTDTAHLKVADARETALRVLAVGYSVAVDVAAQEHSVETLEIKHACHAGHLYLHLVVARLGLQYKNAFVAVAYHVNSKHTPVRKLVARRTALIIGPHRQPISGIHSGKVSVVVNHNAQLVTEIERIARLYGEHRTAAHCHRIDYFHRRFKVVVDKIAQVVVYTGHRHHTALIARRD